MVIESITETRKPHGFAMNDKNHKCVKHKFIYNQDITICDNVENDAITGA